MDTNGQDFSANLKEKLLYSIQSLCEIGEELSSIEEFKSSSKAVLHLIMGTLVISKASILLLDEKSNQLVISASRGIEDAGLTLKLSRDTIRALHAVNEPFLVSEPPDDEIRHFFQKYQDRIQAINFYEWRDNLYHAKIWNVEQNPIHTPFGLCDRFGNPKFDLMRLVTHIE